MNSGRINFRDRKPIDKTPAEYAPMKVSFKTKVELSDLHKKDTRKYKMLGWVIVVYIAVMALIYGFAVLMLKFS